MADKNNNMNWTGMIPMAGGAAQAIGSIGAAQRQHKRNKELMGMQYGNQRLLNEQGMTIGKEMYDYTAYDYKRQMKNLKEAGLNPALIYAGQGAQGSTGASSGGSAGGASAGMPPPMEIGGVMQSAMMKSQIDLNEAQAENLRADATKKTGADTTKVLAEIESINQDVKNKEAQEGLTKLIGKFQEIQNRIAAETEDGQIEKFDYELDKLAGESRSALLRADFDKETYANNVGIVARTLINMQIEGNLKRAGIKKTEEETKSIAEGIVQRWTALDINWKQLDVSRGQLDVSNKQVDVSNLQAKIKQFEAEIKAQYPGLSQVGGNIYTEFIGTLREVFGVHRETKMND